MVDYYSVLLRAVTAPGAGDGQWRRDVYDRGRQMLVGQLRAQRPPPSPAAIRAEHAALEAAIERIEAELSRSDTGAISADATSDERQDDITSEAWIEPQQTPIARPSGLGNVAWIIVAVVAAALGAGGYVVWTELAHTAASPASKSEASGTVPQAAPIKRAEKDGDLPPGIDGGSSEADLSYVFRRQPVFYRTPEPVGTIIVDKPQHLLYLIQPNNVALRYGIGLGSACSGLAGLHRISNRAEWPQWQPAADSKDPKLAQAGALAGGPGNPLGARVLDLNDGRSRIHGTNAPKTIGTSVVFGCIRLVNDDIVDLYNRVQVGTPVIVED